MESKVIFKTTEIVYSCLLYIVNRVYVYVSLAEKLGESMKLRSHQTSLDLLIF